MPPRPSSPSSRYFVAPRSGHSATRRRWATVAFESHLTARLPGRAPSRRDPEQSARLLPELAVVGGDLAELLEDDPAELAAREGQEVGHLGDRDVELLAQPLVADGPVPVAVELVALEEPIGQVLAA